jgi:hypothetical protein
VSARVPRLLFDECLPRPLVNRLVEFVSPEEGAGPVIRHLFDYAPSGTFDEVWIPRFKDEGWTVISADAGRKPNKGRGRKLPLLCAECGITLILLSPVVHSRKSFDKLRTIISVWDQILEIAGDSSLCGKRYMIEPLNLGNPAVGRVVERLVRRSSSEPEQGS